MATTNNPFLTRITVFDGTNWSLFSKDIAVFFQLEGIWGIVEGTVKQPSGTDEAAKWNRNNERAYSMIYFLIGADYRSIIADVSTGDKAWQLLKDEYQKDSSALRLALRNQLYSIRHDPKKPVSTYIEAVRTVARQLKAIGHGATDDELADIILLRLHPSFSSIRSALSNATPFPKLPAIIASVKAFEMQERLSDDVAQAIKKEEDEEKAKEEDNSAMHAREGRRGAKGGDYDWGNSKDRDGVCHRCGRSGHVARRCVADMPEDVKSKLLNKADAAISFEDPITLAEVNGADDYENVAFTVAISSSDSVDPPHPNSPSTEPSIQGEHKKKHRRGHRGRGGNNTAF